MKGRVHFTEPLPSNGKGYTYGHTDRWEEFMKYVVEMVSGAKVHRNWFRHSEVYRGDSQTALDNA
jgi:hypothetical protein